MKKIKIKLITVLSIALTLVSCNDNESGDLTEIKEANNTIKLENANHTINGATRIPRFCDTNFAQNLLFQVTIKNIKGDTRTFPIDNNDIEIFRNALANINFKITNELKKRPFFRSGIESFVFKSKRNVPIAVTTEHSYTLARNGAVVPSFETITRANNTIIRRGRINNRDRGKQLSNIAVSIIVNSDTCLEIVGG